MPFIESKDEFARRQGCDWIITENGRLFANGAKWDSWGTPHEPPTNERELYLAKLDFLRAKRDALIKLYENQRTQINQQVTFHRLKAGPPVDEAWIENCEKLADDVRDAEEKILRFKEDFKFQQVENDPGYGAYLESQEEDARQQARIEERVKHLPVFNAGEPPVPNIQLPNLSEFYDRYVDRRPSS